MKLAFSTNAYTRFSLAEAIRDIGAAGFAGVEILADVPQRERAILVEGMHAVMNRLSGGL